jgi:ADP-L-glycero-D-manno-heptose 6-epimerase
MIVVTGAAGFIGSCLLKKLYSEGYTDLVAVDDFSKTEKLSNYNTIPNIKLVNRTEFFDWLQQNHRLTQFVFHLGARTDTGEFNTEILTSLNLNYSKEVFNNCVKFGLPLVYASSAATYGMGEHGFIDNHDIIENLKPLNPYGVSKNEFDKWVLKQERKPYFWVGIKFFNVFGPNEYHKGRMASVIFHAVNQIKETGKLKLFKSHNKDFKDGEQKRDFIYVKDAVDVLFWWMHHRKDSGIYNLGTGKARTFNDLAKAVFSALNIPEMIEYIDTPSDIRDKYQYFTEADMNKLRSIGYEKPFMSLEDAVNDYVKKYLADGYRWY